VGCFSFSRHCPWVDTDIIVAACEEADRDRDESKLIRDGIRKQVFESTDAMPGNDSDEVTVRDGADGSDRLNGRDNTEFAVPGDHSGSQEDGIDEEILPDEFDPFTSDRVAACPSLQPYSAKVPAIASIDEALARARYENGHDRKKTKKIAFFVAKFHGAMSESRNEKTFGKNNYFCKIRDRCRQALKEYQTTRAVNTRVAPSHEELLALRYCSPRGELNGTIGGMLAEMRILHLAQTAPREDEDEPAVDEDGILACQAREKQIIPQEVEDVAENADDIFTHQDVQQLASEVKAELEKQQQMMDEMSVDLVNKVAATNTKQSALYERVKSEIAAVRSELAAVTATYATQHSDLSGSVAEVRDEIVAVNTRHDTQRAVQQKLMEDLAVLSRKVDHLVTSIQATNSTTFTQTPLGPSQTQAWGFQSPTPHSVMLFSESGLPRAPSPHSALLQPATLPAHYQKPTSSSRKKRPWDGQD
jgi:hypothetical protein